jgi:uncharacterized protein YegP (UPF0339 family)
MYIEFGPISAKEKSRFAFALKVGKGKTIATSPPYSSRATARAKAVKMMNKVIGCTVVYEVPEMKS